LFTSVIRKYKSYLITAAGCLIFSIIYEQFSHDVYSMYMMLAFLIPLIGGILYQLLRGKVNKTMYTTSWVTLLVGSYMKGVLEIYGTTNKLIIVYLIAGILLFIASFFIKKKRTS